MPKCPMMSPVQRAHSTWHLQAAQPQSSLLPCCRRPAPGRTGGLSWAHDLEQKLGQVTSGVWVLLCSRGFCSDTGTDLHGLSEVWPSTPLIAFTWLQGCYLPITAARAWFSSNLYGGNKISTIQQWSGSRFCAQPGIPPRTLLEPPSPVPRVSIPSWSFISGLHFPGLRSPVTTQEAIQNHTAHFALWSVC